MRNANGNPPEPKEIARATFEVPRDLYNAFMLAARERDLTGSQEVRRFMREYIAGDPPVDYDDEDRAAA